MAKRPFKFDASRFLRDIRKLGPKAVRAGMRGIDLAGEQIIGNAQQLTPVATGALQASGTAEPAELKRDRITKTIGFNTDYAAAVHERLDVHHGNGQPKFLETAIRDAASRGMIERAIGGELKREF